MREYRWLLGLIYDTGFLALRKKLNCGEERCRVMERMNMRERLVLRTRRIVLTEIPISSTDNTHVDGRPDSGIEKKAVDSLRISTCLVNARYSTIQYIQMRVLLFDPCIHLVLQTFILWYFIRALAAIL